MTHNPMTPPPKKSCKVFAQGCAYATKAKDGREWRLHRKVLMSRRPGMAESGACTGMCLCRGRPGMAGATLAQESAYATKAKDGREWRLHKKVLMPRRPRMAESGACTGKCLCHEGQGWPGVALAQERVHAAKARSSIYTRTRVAKSRQETKMPAGNSGRYCLQAFICMVARGRFELPTPAL